ncbi:cobyric acid synthase [Bacillus sp. FJAT-42376]|uniref:cobyric acid synthase n=1 Tax=Bacillus sp. FJAT-42376 TaxID=2014076 RepID=UPI000F50506E|nr:cobyric acid synthase [Bacillus sp. FJAT-42376]AZB42679.1 cobyric acid synthase [Bacillus sp. FJAT-42376]
MKGLMLQGTSSDVGKSLLVTALCRIFADKGLNAAPFKSQNMSNNSYVTLDGLEIGRAQGIQAEAAGQEANVYMNPILLKPSSDMASEVVLFGKRDQVLSGMDYRSSYYERGLQAIEQSIYELGKRYSYIIAEGAGSPAEVNLNDRELVNMKVAELADLPVILVADIERGGVFASIFGTLALLSPKDRKRVKGLIINKFRGDIELFREGREWLEAETGVPVLGIVPFLHGHMIEGEDSLSITSLFPVKRKFAIDLAVIKLPYLSNYTDFEPFLFEEDVRIRFIDRPEDLGEPDAIILPGTKSTISDLETINKSGLAQAILEHARAGKEVLGICGGYQMLGERLIDRFGMDTGVEGYETAGLGLLPVYTEFLKEKETIRRSGRTAKTCPLGQWTVKGYEIHMGKTYGSGFEPFLEFPGGSGDEGATAGFVTGTYMHHLFYNDGFRTAWLNHLREKKGAGALRSINLEALKDERYSLLAEQIEPHLDMERIMEMAEGGA